MAGRDMKGRLHKDVALAGLGLLAGRLVSRHRWLRRAPMVGSLAALALRHLARAAGSRGATHRARLARGTTLIHQATHGS
jgi:hypothetical protein